MGAFNGRWFWLVTSFLRFSLQLEPINAVVCLVLVSLGVTRLHMLFKPAWMRTSCIDWLARFMLCFQCCGRVLSFVSLHCTGVRIFVFLCNAGYRARDPGKISRKQHCAGSGAFGTEPWPVPDEPCLFLSGAAGLFSPTTFPEWRKQKIREYICKSLASAASGAVLYLLILKITLWATERRWPITRVVQIFQCLEF